MKSASPFFKDFGPLLFGRPPVSGLKKAFAELSEITSLAKLRQLFGCFFPAALLARKRSGQNSRRRVFPLDVIFWAFLDQVQTPNGSCRETLRKIMAHLRLKSPRSKTASMGTDTSAYCQARARIPLDVLQDIHTHLAERLQKNTLHSELWHGRRIKLVDGTGISMPDTPENQEAWPQSSSQKPGCGFPLMNLVGLFCLSSGALLEVAKSDRRTHESKLFQTLWSTVEKGDIIASDRGFCSYGTFANLRARGADVLMRLPEIKCRRVIGTHLPKSETFDVVIPWERPSQRPPSMSSDDFEALPKSLPIRVIRYSIKQAGFRTRSVTLVTTLVDPTITAEELAALYMRRWEIEIHFREIKIHLNMDVLRCRTPEMIERELHLHLVAYNLIRCVMQKSAHSHNADLGRLSFKGCLDTLRHFANAAQSAEGKPRTIKALVDEMLLVIATDLNPYRPNRSEPRAVKRRPKNYHFLNKPRREMGVLPHRNKGVAKSPKTALT